MKRLEQDYPTEEDVKSFFVGLQNKKDMIQRLEQRRIKDNRRSLSAAITDAGLNPRKVLDRDQLLDCADAVVNNGILRTCINKTIWFVKGSRIKHIVEINDELTEGLNDSEIRRLQKKIDNDTLKREDGQPMDIKGVRKKITRCNKRVGLDDSLTKWFSSVLTFGGGYQQIFRQDNPDWTGQYGEPMALKHLHPLRIVDTKVNPDSYVFEGIYYNFGRKNQNKKLVKPIDLIRGWHDDNGYFDNTYYSGVPPVWSALAASQTIETILDENLPEFVKAISEGIGLLYSGSNKKSVSQQIKQEMQHSTVFIHNFEKMRFDKIDLARDPNELMGIITGLAKYICQAVNLPLFLMFEDTANYATANQVMQVYAVSTINRYRTWLQGVLEDCWYNPILADHLKIDIEDVIEQDIKIKPIFEDINFETRMEKILGEKELFGMNVHERIDVAKAIDDKVAMNRIEQEDAKIEEDRQKSIDEQGIRPDIQRNPQGKLEIKDPNQQEAENQFGNKQDS